MGAPRKHPAKDAVETIERLAAQGYAIIGIAKNLGVSKETFKKWCEEEYALQEAFEVGRDTHRQYLVSLIVEAAKVNKGANANAMFLLKTMHGFREFDSPHTKVDVNVAVANPVMVVRDHGTDAEWQAKCSAQQRALMKPDSAPHQLEAAKASQVDAVASFAPPSYLSPVCTPVDAPEPVPVPVAPSWAAPVKQPATVATVAPSYAPPDYDWQHQPAPAPIHAPEPTPSAPAWRPIAPVSAPVWKGRA
jgi:hypothetical protein